MNRSQCLERLFRPDRLAFEGELEAVSCQPITNTARQRPMQYVPQGVVCAPDPHVQLRTDHQPPTIISPMLCQLRCQCILHVQGALMRASATTFKVEDGKRVRKASALY